MLALSYPSWKAIRKTASVTDSEIIRKYKKTALFDALSTVLQNPRSDIAGYDLTPNEMLGSPTTAEIGSRWSGLPQEQIEALEKEYKAESEAVQALALVDVYYRIRELAAEVAGR
jgi:nuclear pore complex protein Nup133